MGIAVGVDNGHFNIKCFSDSGKGIVPARVRAGKDTQTTFVGNDNSSNSRIFITEDQHWTCGVRSGELNTHEQYNVSAANRVLVHDGLMAAGFSGEVLDICVGLPYDRFYVNDGEKNVDLINGVVANLMEPVYAKDLSSPPNQISSVVVMPEGMAAWFAYFMTETKVAGQTRCTTDKTKMGETVAFVDIGGQTTDVVVVSDKSIKHRHSFTVSLGAHRLSESLKKHLVNVSGVRAVSEQKIVDAITQDAQAIKIKGKAYDLGDFIIQEKKLLVNRIQAEVESGLREIEGDLDTLLYIGGTSESVRNALEQAGCVVADDAINMNARGMYLYRKYLFD